jgi:predicted transcriptional regulator
MGNESLSHENEATVSVSARISSRERAALDQLAEQHDRTQSREIRRAIRVYIEHYELAERILAGEVRVAQDLAAAPDLKRP